MSASSLRRTAARRREEINECFVQQVFFLLSTEGSLVIFRAYQPFTLVGPPGIGLVRDPLAVYSSRTVYL